MYNKIVVICAIGLINIFKCYGQQGITEEFSPLNSNLWTGTVNFSGQKTTGEIRAGNPDQKRGWAKFDISAIPAGYVIQSACLKFQINTAAPSTNHLVIRYVSERPTQSNGLTLYGLIGSGTQLGDCSGCFSGSCSSGILSCGECTSSTGYKYMPLNSTAVSLLQDHANNSTGWFAVGFWEQDDDAEEVWIDGCNASPPTLTITYGPPAPPVPTSNSPQCGSVTLSISGSPPEGVSWYWQGISCGTSTSMGSGSTFTATSSGTYHIRAFDYIRHGWSSECSSVSVTVKQVSMPPESVSASPGMVCPGDSTILIRSGGVLGPNASWIWYSDNCGGVSIGQGDSITIYPDSSANYYVRAENGDCDIAPTACTMASVAVKTTSSPPESILPDTQKICQGDSVVLSISGGTLGTGASWVWRKDSCTSIDIIPDDPLSATIIDYPEETATYFVRAEGDCNTTICDSITIDVSDISAYISSYSSPTCSNSNISATISIIDGIPPYSYLWNDLAAVPDSVVSGLTGGTQNQYSVTDAANCDFTDNIIFPISGPHADLGPDAGFCEGNSITLDAGVANFSYVWSDQSVDKTLEISESGNYFVTVEDLYGCRYTDSINIIIYQEPAVPEIPDAILYTNDKSDIDFNATTSDITWHDSELNELHNGPDFSPPDSTVEEGENYFYAASLSESGCESQLVKITCIYDITGPAIFPIDTPGIFSFGSVDNTLTVGIKAEDEFGVKEAHMLFRKLSAEGVYDTALMAGTNELYNHEFKYQDFDIIGIEYSVLVSDSAGNHVQCAPRYISVYYPDTNPFPDLNLTAGTYIEHYQIIAFPFNKNGQGQDLDIKSQLESNSGFGEYNKFNWRMFEYADNFQNNESHDAFIEFDEPGFSIENGHGYWLIVKDANRQLAISGTLKLDDGKPLSWILKNGWNLVGNPYPFNISWNDIKEVNGELPNSELVTFMEGRLRYADTLRTFQGAFIYSSSDQADTLTIPIDKNPEYNANRIGGMLKHKSTNSWNYPDWDMPVYITAGRIGNNTAGIGMHDHASMDLDPYDHFVLPRFMDYADIEFRCPESNLRGFSRDIRPLSNAETWNLKVETNFPGGITRLEWDPERIAGLPGKLVLQNEMNLMSVDMNSVNYYEFFSNNINYFRILYGDIEYINTNLLPENIFFGNPYPNPASDHITIPVALPDDGVSYSVDINILDATGNLTRRIIEEPLNPGIFSFEWDCRRDNGSQATSGIYLCQVNVSGKNINYSAYKKIILR